MRQYKYSRLFKIFRKDIFSAGGFDGGRRFRSFGGVSYADDVGACLGQCHGHAASEAAFRAGDEGDFAVELECVENSTHVCVLYLRSLGPRVSMSSKVWFSPAMPQTNE